MKIEDRSLSLGMTGNDVKILHSELLQLGFEIPFEETEKGEFGDGTYRAIIEFQKKNKVQPKGIVDNITAKRISRLLLSKKQININIKNIDKSALDYLKSYSKSKGFVEARLSDALRDVITNNDVLDKQILSGLIDDVIMVMVSPQLGRWEYNP